MKAPVRYPELFLPAAQRTPDSFWISLGYFNLYRIAVATLFLTLSLAYGEGLSLGAHSLELFRTVCAAYLLAAAGFQAVIGNLREHFNVQLSLHAAADIVCITLLMYASGGARSGVGVMLLISLIAAAIVAPRRFSFLYAALATIALLLEQGYWVLAHDQPREGFVQSGLFAIGCFVGPGVTGWLAQRVVANEALARQRGRELLTQTRVNELVIDDMHDGVAVLDRDGRVVQHNPQAQRLLRAERLLGAELASLVPRFGEHWAGWRGGRVAAGVAADFEAHGRELGLRLLDTGTEEGFAVLFVEDLSRTREQAQQLKLAALGRLTANIAHEIRNPLAAISHAAELLQEDKRAEDRARLTRIIHDNTLRLERLVSDVLQLNRRDRVSGEPVRLGPWLERFVAEFSANEALPRGRIVVEGARDERVQFDPEHLGQVMWNLVRNAVRYAPAAAGSVRIATRRYADRVEVSVIDDGPGVPGPVQGQLFEPFFTTDSKGTGLGLYLARELCAANQATLEYVTVSDKAGAHFRILCREARTP
jgi:two-component system sensor histidine kinase PilS (NtrC family)